MRDLTKQYRLLYKNGEIVNYDYNDLQSGHTYPAFDLLAEEFDSFEEMSDFIRRNNLIEKIPEWQIL